MSDRIQHDHPSIDSVRATIERSGTNPKLVLPEKPSLFPDGVSRVSIDGKQYHARLSRSFEGVPEIRSVYDNARLSRSFEGVPEIRSVYDNARLARSREPASTNRLREWFEASELDFGRSIHVDVIEPGHQYGIRRPGDDVAYTVIPQPNQSLSEIASDLE